MMFDVRLLDALQGKYDSEAFAARLEEVEFSWPDDGLSISGKFFFLPFQDGEPTLEAFAQYIRGYAPYFCIPRRLREPYLLQFQQTGHAGHIEDLYAEARELFVQAQKSQLTTGEPAELILFMLLEAVLQAPQIACKMWLKTAQNVPVHGSDGIHALPGSAPDHLRLVWGESKLDQDLSGALDRICESLSDFLARRDGAVQRDRDLKIIRDHLPSNVPEALLPLLTDYFNPWKKKSNQKEEAFACFAAFNYSVYQRLATMPREEIPQFFRNQYSQRIADSARLFAEKIRKAGLDRNRFHFFLLPLPSVADLREAFLRHLGVPVVVAAPERPVRSKPLKKNGQRRRRTTKPADVVTALSAPPQEIGERGAEARADAQPDSAQVADSVEQLQLFFGEETLGRLR